MRKVNTDGRVPIKMWLNDIEDGALEQAKAISNLPFVFKHVALMPDAHQGYGMPIGGVVATKDVVVSNFVGVDIGCGVCAVRSTLEQGHCDTQGLKNVMRLIRDRVPVGFNHHKEAQEWCGFDQAPMLPIVQQEIESSKYQLGTLGGGNHFIELQKSSDGRLWIMVHSGSRNFGLKVAKHYHEVSKTLCEKWFSDIPNTDLAFLPISTDEAKQYLSAMRFALSFAKESRRRMVDQVMYSIAEVFPQAQFAEPIDVHHNYARYENHFGKNVIVHRKGATSARDGELGIIPGSQGTASHIVRGLGNPESFRSCSHGAGRRMGRKQAQRELCLDDEIKRLDDAGIIHGIRSEKDLDEAAGAYKDIDRVMSDQEDLVEIVETLTPLAVIKG